MPQAINEVRKHWITVDLRLHIRLTTGSLFDWKKAFVRKKAINKWKLIFWSPKRSSLFFTLSIGTLYLKLWVSILSFIHTIYFTFRCLIHNELCELFCQESQILDLCNVKNISYIFTRIYLFIWDQHVKI